MNLENQLIQSFVDEVCLSAPVHPKIVHHLTQFMGTKISEAVITSNENISILTEYIYAQENQKVYTIFALSSQNVGYLGILVPHLNPLLGKIWGEYVKQFKKDFPEYQKEQLGDQIQKLFTVYHLLRELLTIQVRSTRKSDSKSLNTFVSPGLEVLEKYYKCGRKRKYATFEEATTHLEQNQTSYQCEYCGQYHNGKPMTTQPIPLEIQHKRWETAWRRLHKI